MDNVVSDMKLSMRFLVYRSYHIINMDVNIYSLSVLHHNAFPVKNMINRRRFPYYLWTCRLRSNALSSVTAVHTAASELHFHIRWICGYLGLGELFFVLQKDIIALMLPIIIHVLRDVDLSICKIMIIIFNVINGKYILP